MVDSSSPFRANHIGGNSAPGVAGWRHGVGRTPVETPTMVVSYWCRQGHETSPTFARLRDEEIPVVWECPRCGGPAGRVPDALLEDIPTDGYKSHLDYVKERRTPAEAAALLEAALQKIRKRRGC